VAAGWRIVLEEWAADAFVGEGSKVHGGRWNFPGSAVIYTSQYKSLAALETLVHLDAGSLGRFKAFSFEFPDSIIDTISVSNLPVKWQEEPSPDTTRQLGNAWLLQARSAVLAVPSALIPEELNYLLNPAHADFPKININTPQTFVFDRRLL
jgi:RES domain-containing protein